MGAVHPGGLVCVLEELSKQQFLVDTGSSFTIIPHHSPAAPSGPKLRSASGQPIPCWGVQRRRLCFGGRTFLWPCLLAAVEFNILGVDFLKQNNFLVDAMNGKLVAGHSGAAAVTQPSPVCAAVPAPPSPSPTASSGLSPSPSTVSSASSAVSRQPRRVATAAAPLAAQQSALLEEFSDVLNEEGRLPPSTHGVHHHIVTKGRPVRAKFRRLDGAKRAAAKAEFERLEKEGIVERADSPWASPLHMVMKPDGTWRPCGDFRLLNEMTEPDLYPLPNMADIMASLSGAKVFSKLDLKKGYYQIPVHPDDQKKTAIITPFGLFIFKRMPFGLRNAGMTFQRFMDMILGGLPFVIIYLDDLLVFSPDPISHLQHLREVLLKLRENGLVLNKAKCESETRWTFWGCASAAAA